MGRGSASEASGSGSRLVSSVNASVAGFAPFVPFDPSLNPTVTFASVDTTFAVFDV